MDDENKALADPDSLALFAAIEAEDAIVVGEIAKRRPDLLETPSLDRYESDVPLVKAIRKKSLACVQILVVAGAPLETRDKHGRRPLHYAAAYDPGILSWLIEQGADLTARSRKGRTILMTAMPHPDCARIIIQAQGAGVLEERADGGDTALLMFLEHGEPAAVEALLEMGADPLVVNWDNEGAIMACSKNKCAGLFETLIERGADPLLISDRGHDAMVNFARHGHLEQVKRLLSLGSSPDQACSDGHRALTHALFNGETLIAEELVKAGAELHFLDKNKRSLAQALARAQNAEEKIASLAYLERLSEAEKIKKALKDPEPRKANAEPALRI